jgi:hypothetical protein
LTVYLKTFIKRLLFQTESDLKKKIENLEQEVDNLTKENLKAAELEVLKLSGLPLD